MPDMLEVARQAAFAGGEILRQNRDRIGAVRTKSTSTDLVTQVDIDSGVAIVRTIVERVPGARFVVEEPEVYDLADVSQGTLADDEVWVIDPLDGTTSYVHGYPCYSVSVALLRGSQPIVGCVYDVPLDEMTAAAVGSGATVNGRPIACSNADSIETALLITGFPYDRTHALDRQLVIFERLLRRIHGIRRDGSAAIDCCRVAQGRADGFWEFALRPWDTAAGVVILREAGAVVTDMEGAAWNADTADHVAAGPRLHPLLLEVIAEVRGARVTGS